MFDVDGSLFQQHAFECQIWQL